MKKGQVYLRHTKYLLTVAPFQAWRDSQPSVAQGLARYCRLKIELKIPYCVAAVKQRRKFYFPLLIRAMNNFLDAEGAGIYILHPFCGPFV
jgi:hypothetical protein